MSNPRDAKRIVSILLIDGLRYEYDYDSSTGKGKETDTITMDEFEDKIWREFRHRHIAECTQQV
jgi:hypothetical protein